MHIQSFRTISSAEWNTEFHKINKKISFRKRLTQVLWMEEIVGWSTCRWESPWIQTSLFSLYYHMTEFSRGKSPVLNKMYQKYSRLKNLESPWLCVGLFHLFSLREIPHKHCTWFSHCYQTWHYVNWFGSMSFHPVGYVNWHHEEKASLSLIVASTLHEYKNNKKQKVKSFFSGSLWFSACFNIQKILVISS